jgi:hypothetical protein
MKHSHPRGATVIRLKQWAQRGCAAVVLPLFFAAFFLIQFPSVAQVSNIYSTGFELSEGFDIRYTVMGQDGWTGTDPSGSGNGIVKDYFANTNSQQQPFGRQQAYIGFSPLTDTNGTLNVWRPLNFDPVAAALPIVTFSVTMSIYNPPSMVPDRDSFRWSIYNTNNGGERLFTLDFDNATREINYELDDEQFVFTDRLFENGNQYGGEYDLVVIMNFADNLWSAWLNDDQIVDHQEMTTQGLALNLGDIDAVWVNATLDNPGDNFMAFDNYAITAEPYPFSLDPVVRLSNGTFLLRLTGEPGRQYDIEVSEDLKDWFLLKTEPVDADGTMIVDDPTASDYNRSFYRARLVR